MYGLYYQRVRMDRRGLSAPGETKDAHLAVSVLSKLSPSPVILPPVLILRSLELDPLLREPAVSNMFDTPNLKTTKLLSDHNNVYCRICRV